MFVISIFWYLGVGVCNGFKWYGRRIKESKWYIIPLIIDTALIPLKIIVIPLLCLKKEWREYFIRNGEEMEED